MQLLKYNVKNVVIHMLNIRYILMEFIQRLKKNDEVDNALKGLGLWCLTPLSTIFQPYRGGNALINSEKLLVLYVKML